LRRFGPARLLPAAVFDPASELPGGFVMTCGAECTDVREVAFPATLDHRDDMVGIPKGLFAENTSRAHPQRSQYLQPGGAQPSAPDVAQGKPKNPAQSLRVTSAYRTDAPIPFKGLSPQVTWIRPEPVLVNAIPGAEGAPVPRHLQVTPAA